MLCDEWCEPATATGRPGAQQDLEEALCTAPAKREAGRDHQEAVFSASATQQPRRQGDHARSRTFKTLCVLHA